MITKHRGILLLFVLTLITAFSSCTDPINDVDPATIPVKITIDSPPNKLEYELNEQFDSTGLRVASAYINGSTKNESISAANISGFDSSSPGEKTITIAKNGLSATFTVTVKSSSPVLASLSISSEPDKKTYEQGESADWTGLEVRETYSDSSSRIETDYHNYDISGFDSSSAGEKTITVTKNGLNAMFAITVNPPSGPETVLVSLSISSEPNKKIYEQGESADWTGLRVRETYSDNSSRVETNYSNYDISGFNSSSAGVKTITVSKNTINTTFTVTVNPPSDPGIVLVSLSISSEPDKKMYELGESANWSGLIVTGTYSDGSTKNETISNSNISGFDSSNIGVKTITVTKSGKSATFTVTVRELVSLSISSLPNKLAYEQGESADWSGLEVTGTYFDGSNTRDEIIDHDNYDIDGFDSSSPGEKYIYVSKNGISDWFTVTVNPPPPLNPETVLISLSILLLPDKREYELGDEPDWTGMVVEGIYSDVSNTWEEIIDHGNCDISGFDSSSPGEKYIYVSKNGASDWFTVTVEGLSSLSISMEPNKKVYELGESPDWTGLTVVGDYFIKGLQIIDPDNCEISGFDSSRAGEQTITVTKSGISAPPFTVEVLPKGSGSITILLPPSLEADIVLTWAGTTVTASDGYTDYQWFVDDMPRPADGGSDGKAITLSAPDYASGIHRVRVMAHIQGIPYSEDTTVTLTLP